MTIHQAPGETQLPEDTQTLMDAHLAEAHLTVQANIRKAKITALPPIVDRVVDEATDEAFGRGVEAAAQLVETGGLSPAEVISALKHCLTSRSEERG